MTDHAQTMLPTVSAMITALGYMRTHSERMERDALTVSGSGEGAEIYCDAARCIEFALAAIPREQEAKPVAWRFRHVNYVDWSLSKEKPNRAGLEIEPLYTAPPSDSLGSTHQPQNGDAREGVIRECVELIEKRFLVGWAITPNGLAREDEANEILEAIKELLTTPPAPGRAAAEPGEAIKKILLIAEDVCWFDWSGDNNDADAIHAIDQLRIALAALSPTSANEDLAP